MSYYQINKIKASHSASFSPQPKGQGGSYSKVAVKFQMLLPRPPGTFIVAPPVKTFEAQGSYSLVATPSTWQWDDPSVEFSLNNNASVDIEIWCEGVIASSKRIYGTQLSYLTLNKTATLSWKLHTPASTGTLTGDLTIHITRSTAPPAALANPPIPLPTSASSLGLPKIALTKSHKNFNFSPSTIPNPPPPMPSQGSPGSTDSSPPLTTPKTDGTTDGTKPSQLDSTALRIAPKSSTAPSAWNTKIPEPVQMSLARSHTVGSAAAKDGLSSRKLQHEKLPVGLSKTRFLRVACSMFGAIAIAEDGSLHYWTLDSEKSIYTEGGPVPKLESVTIVDIAAGHDHYLAVTVDGEIYAWGSNQFSQCIPEPVTRAYTPTKLNHKNVLGCSAGAHSSLLIDANGVVFTWGKAERSVTIPASSNTSSAPFSVLPSANEHQERPRTKPTHRTIIVDSLGHGDAQTSFRGSTLYVHEPTMVALPEPAQFLQASMSSTMTVLVSREGKVYAWGDANAICGGPSDYSATPVPIPFPKEVRIVRALAGDFHALALDALGHLWTWGGCFIGGALNPTLKNPSPEPRRLYFGRPDEVVVDFGMSQDISSALTSSSELWTWDQFCAPMRVDSIPGEIAVGVSHGTSSSTLFVLLGSDQIISRSSSQTDTSKAFSSVFDSSSELDSSMDEDEVRSLLDGLDDSGSQS